MGMSLVEAAATVLTLVSVLLAARLKVALYPVGIAATALFFFVFLEAKLYASAALQVYFTAFQVYGWWFWLRGDRGGAPSVGDWGWGTVALFAVPAALLTVAVSAALQAYTDAATPFGDTAILALSVLAQFLLDRKQLKSWIVWAAVNILSIGVYAASGLWLTAALYVVLLANTAYGWRTWKAARARQLEASPA
jgi:nicotinamide mononucleotide transporter